MSLGPGKYDALCKEVLVRTKAAGVLMVILDGELGSGCPCKMDQTALERMPALLRRVADSMEGDVNRVIRGGGEG